jgi:hypothetical protein
MALWGKNDQYSDAPKFVVDAATGQDGQDQFGNTVFGVDTTEAGVTPVTHAGWVRRVEGTGGRAGRIQYETLVATGTIAGDATGGAGNTTATANSTGTADDTLFPDS